jgi:hypothetical protein
MRGCRSGCLLTVPSRILLCIVRYQSEEERFLEGLTSAEWTEGCIFKCFLGQLSAVNTGSEIMLRIHFRRHALLGWACRILTATNSDNLPAGLRSLVVHGMRHRDLLWVYRCVNLCVYRCKVTLAGSRQSRGLREGCVTAACVGHVEI